MSRFTLLVLILVIIQTLLLKGLFSVPVEANTELSEEVIAKLLNSGKVTKDTLSLDKDPCVDFYGYVCNHANLSLYQNQDISKLADILDNYFLNTDKLTTAEQKLKSYLLTCKTIEEDDVKKFVREFNFPKSIGGWPAFDVNWQAGKFDWQAAMAELETYFTSVIINQRFDVTPITFKKRIFVGVEDFDITQKSYRKERLLKRLSNLGIENAEKVFSDAVLFEKDCAEVISLQKTKEEQIEETDFAGLKQKIPEIDWNKQMEIIVGGKLEDNFNVVISGGDILRKVIDKVTKTDPKIVANYFFCNFVYHIPDVCKDNSNECFRYVIDNASSAVSGVIIKRFFTGKSKAMLYGMIHSFIQNLQEFTSVFGEMTTTEVTENIDQFINEEHLPSLSDESLAKEFENIEIDVNSFLRTTYTLRREQKRIAIQSVLSAKDGKFDMVNVLLGYMISLNLYKAVNEPSFVAFNAVALDPIVYHVDSGGLQTIGKSTRECISQQFNQEDVKDEELTSILAAKIFTKGYFDWAEKNENLLQVENKILIEYGLTSRKMLLIRLMQYGCGTTNPNTIKRISSIFWNMNEFKDAFNCPEGSPMNPMQKCQF